MQCCGPPARAQRIVDGAEEVQGADGDVRGVPEFWYVCLRNHPEVASMMGEKDHDVLKYLRSVKDEKLEGTPGFKLVFEFAPNEHFTNTVLEKTYEMAEEDEDMLAQCTGTKIEWAAGKDITMKLMKKKGKKGKTQFKTEKADSFFNFFNPPRVRSQALALWLVPVQASGADPHPGRRWARRSPIWPTRPTRTRWRSCRWSWSSTTTWARPSATRSSPTP